MYYDWRVVDYVMPVYFFTLLFYLLFFNVLFTYYYFAVTIYYKAPIRENYSGTGQVGSWRLNLFLLKVHLGSRQNYNKVANAQIIVWWSCKAEKWSRWHPTAIVSQQLLNVTEKHWKEWKVKSETELIWAKVRMTWAAFCQSDYIGVIGAPLISFWYCVWTKFQW